MKYIYYDGYIQIIARYIYDIAAIWFEINNYNDENFSIAYDSPRLSDAALVGMVVTGQM